MTDRPRMTVQVSTGPEGDHEIELHLNPAARKKLIDELSKLDRADDHFHVFSFEDWNGLQLSKIPYSPGDKIACALKILLRYDDWDTQHFPHVMEPPSEE